MPILCATSWPSSAAAFCGFYVAKADAKLWNRASRVVLVRDGDRTVLTMANDYEGEPREFAMVVPVPTVLEREQIHVGEAGVIEHLDAFTAPRLVEYFDPDPCSVPRAGVWEELAAKSMRMLADAPPPAPASASGVRIEARYSVGEYDILILLAEESAGLATWLREEGEPLVRALPELREALAALQRKLGKETAPADRGPGRRTARRDGVGPGGPAASVRAPPSASRSSRRRPGSAPAAAGRRRPPEGRVRSCWGTRDGRRTTPGRRTVRPLTRPGRPRRNRSPVPAPGTHLPLRQRPKPSRYAWPDSRRFAGR